jgi:hypothetical protein
MQHLMLEALARLVDEPPDETESAHLRECESCRTELADMRRDTAALARLGPIDPAEADWTSLADRLARERLIGPVTARRFRGASLLKLAAALALYAVGTATGLALRTRPAPSAVASTSAAPGRAGAPAPLAPVSAAPESYGSTPTSDDAARAPAAEAAALARNVASVADASTPEEAVRALQLAERAYLRAYARYAELTSSQQSEDPVARVAALESIVLTTRQALDRAPADPLINGYHLTAVAQRDAALRQIALRSNGGWF